MVSHVLVSGLAKFTLDRDRGRDFIARRVLQNPGKTADDTFVELAKNSFFFILAAIVNVHLVK